MIERELAAVPREARPYQGESAGVVTRLVANTIDAVVVGLALGVLYLAVAAIVFMLDPREFTFPAAGLLLSLTAALTMSTTYLALAWWLVGKTYGDHIMGLRVVGRRRRRLGPLRSLARAAFCVFFPIGLFWCVISPHRRSVQDVVLWTRVVYDWLPADRSPEHDHGHHHEHLDAHDSSPTHDHGHHHEHLDAHDLSPTHDHEAAQADPAHRHVTSHGTTDPRPSLTGEDTPRDGATDSALPPPADRSDT